MREKNIEQGKDAHKNPQKHHYIINRQKSKNISSKATINEYPVNSTRSPNPAPIISTTTKRIIIPASIEIFIVVTLFKGFFYKIGCETPPVSKIWNHVKKRTILYAAEDYFYCL